MVPIFEVVPDKKHRPIFTTIWDVDQTGVPFFVYGNADRDDGAPLRFIFLNENDAIVAQGAISVARET